MSVADLMKRIDHLDDAISEKIEQLEQELKRAVRVPLTLELAVESYVSLHWMKRHGTWHLVLEECDLNGCELVRLQDTSRTVRSFVLKEKIPQLLEQAPSLLEEIINERKQAILAGQQCLELVKKIMEKTE